MWFPSRIFAALITVNINPKPACSSLSLVCHCHHYSHLGIVTVWGGVTLQMPTEAGMEGSTCSAGCFDGVSPLTKVLLLTCALSSLLFAPIFQAAAQDRKWFKSQENVITNPQILAGDWRVGEVSESTFNSFFQGHY